jgi:nitroreductase
MSTHLAKSAVTDAPLHPLLAQRWSPRGFDTAHRVDDEMLTSLLEAARWAPSANNTQPWRFLVAHRGQEHFDGLVELLAPGNQLWAQSASALILVATQVENADGDRQPWAFYDTGQAVAALSVQAQALGLAVHQMGGFDIAGTTDRFELPAGVVPVVVVAVGQFDGDAVLPEALAEREQAPRTRQPLESLLLAPSSGAVRAA